ncbi:MAG: hypothetical protein E6X17_02630, partial [Sporomusaceae bacterium]|nr:hypothetical protein [Sporomusaceae bacterium]
MRQKVVSQGGGRRHTGSMPPGDNAGWRRFDRQSFPPQHCLCTRPDPAKALKSDWPAKGPKLAALKQR